MIHHFGLTTITLTTASIQACINLSKQTRDGVNGGGKHQHYLNESFHTSRTLDEPSVISATMLLVKMPAHRKHCYDMTLAYTKVLNGREEKQITVIMSPFSSTAFLKSQMECATSIYLKTKNQKKNAKPTMPSAMYDFHKKKLKSHTYLLNPF